MGQALKCIYEPNGGGIICNGEVEMCPALTAYHWDPEMLLPDPNADFPCCEAHYKDYTAYWQDMWNEYMRDRW